MGGFNSTNIKYVIYLYQARAKETLSYNYRAYKSEDLKRQFEKLTKLGYAALPDDQYMELQNAITAMETNYAKIRVCAFLDPANCTLQLEPGLIEFLKC